MKKRIYLKESVESFLANFSVILITLIAITIENIGNHFYNKLLFIAILILTFNFIILNKYAKPIK